MQVICAQQRLAQRQPSIGTHAADAQTVQPVKLLEPDTVISRLHMEVHWDITGEMPLPDLIKGPMLLHAWILTHGINTVAGLDVV